MAFAIEYQYDVNTWEDKETRLRSSALFKMILNIFQCVMLPVFLLHIGYEGEVIALNLSAGF